MLFARDCDLTRSAFREHSAGHLLEEIGVDGLAVKKGDAVLVDISGGGIGLTVPPDDVNFKVNAEFSNVSINLPNVGLISANMRVRNIYDVTMPNGKVHQRAGCQFIKLPGPMMTLIQRYIIQIERERKSREM